MKNQAHTRLLLIAPRFFGYENDIAAELTQQGMQVDMLPDRPFNTPFSKAVMRFRPEFGHGVADRFFADRLDQLGRTDYAIILVIQGEGVTANTLKALRRNYPGAKLVFHTWDSLENKPFSRKNLPHYDRYSTFDPVDARQYGMVFRPLFYSNGFDRPAATEFSYDLSFIGTIHSDRYRIVKMLSAQLPPDASSFIYLYLQAPWMYDLRRLFTRTLPGARRNEFRFLPLSKDVVQTTFFGSRAVLDIEHPNQHGVTMRTIEAVGSRRKMITTNATVRDYDFFDPQNIMVIDRKRPVFDAEFLRTPYREIAQMVRQKYSLHQWVRDVCGLDITPMQRVRLP